MDARAQPYPRPWAGPSAADDAAAGSGAAPAAVEAALRRMIGRLCIAARGLDARLDAQLSGIAAAMRHPCSPERLEAQIAELSRVVAALPDRHATPAAASPLALLLERTGFPPVLQARAQTLRHRIDDGGDTDAALAEQLAALLAEKHALVEREKADAERLLQQVTQRLDEMTGYLQSASRDRRDAQDQGRELDSRLRGEMQALDRNLGSTDDIAALQLQVRARLEQIDGHLRRHREREDARWREYQARADGMRRRIEELERSARSLRESAERGHQLAMTDALTGIPNRLAYDTQVRACYAGDAAGAPPVIAVCDIDHFKRINDRWGHAAGDRVLRVVARVLTGNVRQNDFVARYGGEEFVIVFEGLPPAAALRRADVLRRLVEQIEFHVGQETVPVTISCGLAIAQAGEAPQQTFERADQALYRAKRGGRNRCACA